MRIIHCADLHLDSALTTHLDKYRANKRRKELLDSFRRMMVYASENDVSAVIIAGDLFDSETVSAGTVSIVLGEISRYRDVEVYYLKGNHDPGNHIFDGKNIPENLHLFGSEWTYYILSDVVLSGVVLDNENCNRIYETLDISESDINIVVLHGQERNYRVAQNSEDICLECLRDRGIDYLALGHIHKPKRAKLDHRGIYAYAGCLEGRGFDECGEHGFWLLDIDELNRTIASEFISFAYRRSYEIDVDITGVEDNQETADLIAERLYTAMGEEAVSSEKNLIRISLVGEVDVESEIDIEYLTRQFEDSFYYFEIVNRTKQRVDVYKYMHDSTLKGEFVRMVLGQNLSDEDKAAVIQTGIRALDGEEVWIR